MSVKSIPNLLSICRILFSFICFFVFDYTYIWLALYAFAGITDVLDGYAARRLNACSDLGTRLDSLGDYIFYTMTLVYFMVHFQSIILNLWLLILTVILLHMANLTLGYVKFKQVVSIHTYLKKLTGLMTFFIPFCILFWHQPYYLILTLLVAILGCLEETILILRAKEVNLNEKSVFLK